MPRLIVALPVFNGASLIGEALENLRCQTYNDFEIWVFDNNSSDATFDIANRAASLDKRIRVVRRQATISAVANFQSALEAADCDYFCWRAYDDLSASNYLECMVKVLAEQQKVNLAAGNVYTLKPQKSPDPKIRNVPSLPPGLLAQALTLMHKAPAAWIYGLFRKAVLLDEFSRASAVLPQGWATDHLTLFPFLISGQVGLSRDTHFVQRIIKEPSKTTWTQGGVAAKLETRRSFQAYCSQRIDEAGDLSAASKLVLKASLPGYAARRTYGIGQIIRGVLAR